MYKEKLFENRKLIIISMLIILVLSYAYSNYMIKLYSDYNYEICKLDLILSMFSKYCISSFLTIIPAFFNLYMTKYDFNINMILRYKDKKIIWIRQNIHIIINSFLITCSVIGLNYIVGMINGKTTYNWNSEDSLFYRQSQGLVIYDKQFSVILFAIIFGALIISLISILCNLIYWITDSQVMANLIIIIYCMFNLIKNNYFNIFNKLSLKSIDFVNKNIIFSNLFILFLIIALLVSLPLIFIRKKEFLSRGQN